MGNLALLSHSAFPSDFSRFEDYLSKLDKTVNAKYREMKYNNVTSGLILNTDI